MSRVTTLTSTWQVTIPNEVRDKLGLRPHDTITFLKIVFPFSTLTD